MATEVEWHVKGLEMPRWGDGEEAQCMVRSYGCLRIRFRFPEAARTARHELGSLNTGAKLRLNSSRRQIDITASEHQLGLLAIAIEGMCSVTYPHDDGQARQTADLPMTDIPSPLSPALEREDLTITWEDDQVRITFNQIPAAKAFIQEMAERYPEVVTRPSFLEDRVAVGRSLLDHDVVILAHQMAQDHPSPGQHYAPWPYTI